MLCGIVWHRLGWVPLGIILSRVAVHVYLVVSERRKCLQTISNLFLTPSRTSFGVSRCRVSGKCDRKRGGTGRGGSIPS